MNADFPGNEGTSLGLGIELLGLVADSEQKNLRLLSATKPIS